MAIFTSPLRPAVETAQLVSEATGAPYEVEAGLIEYDVGILEGATYADGRDQVDAFQRRWASGDFSACIPGGESWNDIHARFSQSVAKVVARFDGASDAAVVLVGHGGTFCQALPSVLGNVAPSFALSRVMAYASIVEAQLLGGLLRCLRWDREAVDL